MPCYDLHSHSWVSDGTLSPTDLVRRAAAAGVDVLALTDHDDTDGCAEALRTAPQVGMTVIPGAEISVTWQGLTVHIVGLQLEPAAPALVAGLEGLRRFRQWRAEEMGRRLAARGIDGAYEGARALARGRIISRTHFARYLVDRGCGGSVREVFKHYLVYNKPGHVPGQWAALDEAVGWIRAAGGVAVVAHPARYNMTSAKLRRLLGEFSECGGRGLEVVSGSHSRQDTETMAGHARKFGLLASAGSDYHGPENPWVELGRLPALPEGVTPLWSQWETPSAHRQGVA